MNDLLLGTILAFTVRLEGCFGTSDAIGGGFNCIAPYLLVCPALGAKLGRLGQQEIPLWRELTSFGLYCRPSEARYIVEAFRVLGRVPHLFGGSITKTLSVTIVSHEAFKVTDKVRFSHRRSVAEHAGRARLTLTTHS